MSNTHVPVLEKNYHKMLSWLYEIEEKAHLPEGNENRALSILKATLHELRDNLRLNDLAHFSAQLPIIVRGILFEGWNPSKPQLKERKKDDFLAGVFNHLPEKHKDLELEEAIKAVLATIADHIDAEEIDKLRKVLPRGIVEYLP